MWTFSTTETYFDFSYIWSFLLPVNPILLYYDTKILLTTQALFQLETHKERLLPQQHHLPHHSLPVLDHGNGVHAGSSVETGVCAAVPFESVIAGFEGRVEQQAGAAAQQVINNDLHRCRLRQLKAQCGG